MKISKKALVLALCAVLLIGATVFATVAFLTDSTDDVVNTFTIGKVAIDLYETETSSSDVHVTARDDIKIVVGSEAFKDPTVEVLEDSEDCWLFVKVVEENNLFTDSKDNEAKIIEWAAADGWTVLEAACVKTADGNYTTTVLYREGASAEDVFSVFADDKVTFSADITSDDADAITTNAPTITLTAYAIQSDNVANVTDAWAAFAG